MESNSVLNYTEMPTNFEQFKIMQKYVVHPLGCDNLYLAPLENRTFVSTLVSIKTQIALNIFNSKKEDLTYEIVFVKFTDFVMRHQFEKIVYTDGSKKRCYICSVREVLNHNKQ